MSYDEKFIPFNDKDVEEFNNILNEYFSRPFNQVVKMNGPVYPIIGGDMTARTEKYDSCYGPFKKIFDRVESCKIYDPITILVGLYGYYPGSSYVRYGLKITY